MSKNKELNWGAHRKFEVEWGTGGTIDTLYGRLYYKVTVSS